MKKTILLIFLLLITVNLYAQDRSDYNYDFDYPRFKAQYPKLTYPLYRRVIRECGEHDIYNKIVRVDKPYDIAVRTILAIIHAESRFNPKALGKAGDWSYMQLMWYNLPRHYVKPLDTIHYGVSHFEKLLVKYKGSTVRAVNAYNRGKNKKHDINYLGKILDNIER